MRLGCDVTAFDINPVAWFILKCTLEYPQRLANQTRPLPTFARQSPEFMEHYFKAKGFKGAALHAQLASLGFQEGEGSSQPTLTGIKVDVASVEADVAWHVRAWGWWVLQQARADLERFYPTVGGKRTVAYLWARTVTCKNCRATVPMLKTRWLCKKDNKRVALTMEPNTDKTGVIFGVQNDVPIPKGTTAHRREHDKSVGGGTMSRSGVTCPCCGTVMNKQDIQQIGLKGCLGATMTAVVVDGSNGKEYRLPIPEEIRLAAEAANETDQMFAQVSFGLPNEPLTLDAKGNTWCILYGFDTFQKLFTSRQLLSLGSFVKHTIAVSEFMHRMGYSSEWKEAIRSYLACTLSKTIHLGCSLCTWHQGNQQIRQVFARYALPLTWDFAESVPIGKSCGSYLSMLEFIEESLINLFKAVDTQQTILPTVKEISATQIATVSVDVIVTDPPYYDAIGYSVLMDFFYVWLRRMLYNLSPDIDKAFQTALSPKWDHEHSDGELIDDASRFNGDRQKSKSNYEAGMSRVFQAAYKALTPEGRLVVVFAHKQPDAWETLVSAIILAGFVVDASWPIQTELISRTRALSSAALASSIWLVCKKRPETARPGWDSRVLEEMQEKIIVKLRDFWDAGIRGPDFVWAATGPAMEAYSKHPVVKKLNEPGQTLSVAEFLRHVRRMVADFVVGRVLSHNGGAEAVSGLDDVTTYYLLHRYDFGMESAPIGPCILYAVSCNLKDADLISRFDLLARTGGQSAVAEDDEEASEESAAEPEEGTSSTVRLKPWEQRKSISLGYNAPGTPAPPLIDQLHRLMHLWKAGDVSRVDEYLDARGLGHNQLFHQLLQALIELASAGSDERALIESISNHVASRGSLPMYPLGLLE